MRETPKAHAAFELYWSMGDARSIRRLAQQLHKSEALIGRWSREHHWQARIIARQDQAEAERERQKLAAIASHERRLCELGEEGEALAFATLKERAESGKLGAMAAVQLLALSAKLTLRGYREPESITRNEHTGPGGGPIELDDPRELIARRLARLAPGGGTPGDPLGAER